MPDATQPLEYISSPLTDPAPDFLACPCPNLLHPLTKHDRINCARIKMHNCRILNALIPPRLKLLEDEIKNYRMTIKEYRQMVQEINRDSKLWLRNQVAVHSERLAKAEAELKKLGDEWERLEAEILEGCGVYQEDEDTMIDSSED